MWKRHLFILLFWVCLTTTALTACQLTAETNAPESIATIAVTRVPATATPAIITGTLETLTDTESIPTLRTLLVHLAPNTDLQNYPPATPFTLYFNRGMIYSQNQYALTVEPAMNGQLIWEENFTKLSFVPEGGFAPNTTYTIRLDPTLQSAEGLTFETPQVWALQTLPIPSLVAREPEASRFDSFDTPIRLEFNRPLSAESVSNSLQVSPEVAVNTSWEGNTLVITPETAWPMGTLAFKLPKTAVTPSGEHLAKDITWTYYSPNVVRSIIRPTNSDNGRIIIDFEWPVDPATLQLTFEPALDTQWVWNEEHTQVTAQFTPLHAVSYEVNFGEGLKAPDGRSLPTPKPFTFTTPSLIQFTTPNDWATQHPAYPIEIAFKQAMNPTTTANALHITPDVPGRTSWQGDVLRWEPLSGILEEHTNYTMRLDTSATTADGRLLFTSDYIWHFITTESTPLANFGTGDNWQVLDPDGLRAIPFAFTNNTPTNLSFNLYRLNLSQWLNEQVVTDEWVQGWEFNRESPVFAQNKYNYDFYTPVYTTTIPAEVAPGAYVLRMSSPAKTEGEMVIFLTHYGLVLRRNANTLTALLGGFDSEATDGDALGNGNTTITFSNNGASQTGHTDDSGFFTAPVNNNQDPIRAIAQIGSEVTFASVDVSHNYPETNLLGFVTTDSPAYHVGDELNYYAILRLPNGRSTDLLPAGTAVNVVWKRLSDSTMRALATWQSTVSDFGTINGRYTIPTTTEPGTYQLIINANGGTLSRLVEVLPTVNNVHVQATATHYTGNEPVTVTIDTTYPNTAIEVTAMLAGSKNWYSPTTLWAYYSGMPYVTLAEKSHTDSNGRFTFTFTPNPDLLIYDDSPAGNWLIVALIDAEEWGENPKDIGYTVVNVADTTEQIALAPDTLLRAAGQAFPVSATVTDWNGQPVNGRSLQITAFAVSGDYEYEQTLTPVQSANFVTDANGHANTLFTVSKPGRYLLRVSGQDSQGYSYSDEHYVYITQSGYSGSYLYRQNLGVYEPVRVELDRSAYNIGETAHVLLHSLKPQTGWLIFSQNGAIVYSQTVSLTPPLTVVDFPVLADSLPSLTVSFYGWNNMPPNLEGDYPDPSDLHNIHLISKQATAQVYDPAPLAQVSLTAVSPSQPIGASVPAGAMVDVTVHVTNSRGEPISAEVNLQLLNKDVLDLYPQGNTDLTTSFRFSANNVSPSWGNSQNWYQYFDGWGGEGGCGGDGWWVPYTPASNDFDNTSRSFAGLVTNANGDVTISIPLPNLPATWRLTAYATTADTQIGTTFIELVTK